MPLFEGKHADFDDDEMVKRGQSVHKPITDEDYVKIFRYLLLKNKIKKYCRLSLIVFLVLMWISYTVPLLIFGKPVTHHRSFNIRPGGEVFMAKGFTHDENLPKYPRVTISFIGGFLEHGKQSARHMVVQCVAINKADPSKITKVGNKEEVAIADKTGDDMRAITPVEVEKLFHFTDDEFHLLKDDSNEFGVQMSADVLDDIPFTMEVNGIVAPEIFGILIGSGILIIMYVCIIFELIHRTFAAMIACTASIAALCFYNTKPSMIQCVAFIDAETILLLFSMMIFVSVMGKTGFFDYVAVISYKLTGGQPWPLIHYLSLFTGLSSMVLDNVTTVMLMTPVIIRICEVSDLNPVPILIIIIHVCNIAGVATPMGDPPNIMIINNEYLKDRGATFMGMLIHMMLGVLFTLAVCYIPLRFVFFRDINKLRFTEHPEIQELKREISVWKSTVQKMSAAYSTEEDIIHQTIQRKIEVLERKLNRKIHMETASKDQYEVTVLELSKKFFVRDRPLLYKCFISMGAMAFLFVMNHVPGVGGHDLSLGWVMLLGVILLLILTDDNDLEHHLHQVEWATLLFFTCLFILMECLTELGVIRALGLLIEKAILSVDQEWQRPLAIILILWIAGTMSAFVDNIPLTSMMLKILPQFNENSNFHTPLFPLVLSLSFAVGYGGNGTLIASTANIVCAGVAEAHGHVISFNEFFKTGFPIMLISLFAAMIYLLVCHVAFHWD